MSPTGRARREAKALIKSQQTRQEVRPSSSPEPKPSPLDRYLENLRKDAMTQLERLTAGQCDGPASVAALPAVTPSAAGPPTHRLLPEQFILLELVKSAMHTSDENYPSAQDALWQMDNLKELSRVILEFHLS